ncbi:MAG: hypothetical protein ACK5L6_03970 [Anaerorhabdus sp.]|uniref:hypothetical protein n=1 Tax=Anaerorhabdus sp. TaxID=1872524 RepID=UPI003A87FF10
MPWIYDEETNQMKYTDTKEKWIYDQSQNQMVINPEFKESQKKSASNVQTSFKKDGLTSTSRKMGSAPGNNEVLNKTKSATASTITNSLGNIFALYDTTKQNIFDYFDTINPKVNKNYEQYSTDKLDLLLKQNENSALNPMYRPNSGMAIPNLTPTTVDKQTDITQPGMIKLNVNDPYVTKKEEIEKAKEKLYQSEIHNQIDWDGTLTKKMKDYSSEEREKVYDGIDNPIVKGALDLGFTIGDMAPGYALTALNPFAGSAYFGANAAGNQMYDVSNRGVTADKAMESGVMSGMIESATETLPLSFFSDSLKLGGKLGTNIARQALTEGAEEGLSYVLGNYAEQNILGDKAAEFSNEELFQNILMGGLSGGLFGGAGTAIGNHRQNKILNAEAKTESDLVNQIEFANAVKENAFDTKEAERMQNIADIKQYELNQSQKLKEENFEKFVANKAMQYETQGLSEGEVTQQLENDVQTYMDSESNFITKALNDDNVMLRYEAERENNRIISESGRRYKVTEDNIKVIQDAAKKIGVAIRFEDAKNMPHGSEGYYRKGEIVISNETKNPVLQVLGHELTHYAEGSDYYEDFKTVARDIINKQGRNYEGLKQELISEYAARNVELTDLDAEKEVLAHVAQELIQSESDLNDLARSNRNVAQKILNWIKVQISKFSKNGDLIRARDILSKALSTTEVIDSGKTQFLLDKEGKEIKYTTKEINDKIRKLKSMNEVFDLSDVDIAQSLSPIERRKKMIEIFNKSGNIAFNPILGEIVLNNSSAKNNLGHKSYLLKNISFEAIIPTLENGEIIDLKQKENNNSVESALIAAPVKVSPKTNDKGLSRAYLLARIKQDENSNRFYLHDVTLSELKEKDNNASLTGSAIRKITSDTSLSNQNINQEVENVNESDTKKYSLGLTLDDVDLSRKNDFKKRVAGYDLIKKNTLENITSGADEYTGQQIANYLDEAAGQILKDGVITKELKKKIVNEFIDNSQSYLKDIPVKTSDSGETMINYLKSEIYDQLQQFENDVIYKSNKKVYDRYAKKIMQEGTVYNRALNTLSNLTADTEDLKAIREEMKNKDIKVMPSISKLVAVIDDYGALSKTLSQNLDVVASKDPEVRKQLYNIFEKPLYDAKKKFVEAKTKKINDIYKKIVKEYNVKKGSDENAAVMWYGEGQRMKKDRKGNPIFEDINKVELEKYTLVDLKNEFPNNWQNIIKSEQYLRSIYDELIDRINGVYETIYSNEDLKQEEMDKKERIQKEIFSSRQQLTELIENGAKGLAIPESQAIVNKLNAKIKRLSREFNNVHDDVYRNKRVQKRTDYFHHIQEESLTENFANLFNQDNAMNISNELSGISEHTKPKTKWQGFMQRRGQGRYKEDAIESILDYINAAEYSIAMDPVIDYYRKITKQLVKASDEAGISNGTFINWFNNYTNDLAGKTNPIDRIIAHTQGGRKSLYYLGKLNSVVKKNAILGNVNSAFSQFFNLPNAVGLINQNGGIKASSDWTKGSIDYLGMLKDKLSGSYEGNIINQSTFLQERYIDSIYDQFDEGMLKNVGKLAKWMLQVGDRTVSEATWYAAYEQGIRKNVDNPIEYADDITRKAVAGRGIGEVPLMQKSKLVGLVAPFQVEVNNAYQILKRMGGSPKDWVSLLSIFVTTFLMNQIFEPITGNRVGADFIDAFMDSWKTADEKNKNPIEKTFSIGGRMSGELFSNMPMGSQIAEMLGFDDYTKEKLFGESDPSRFGTGNIGLQSLSKPIGQLFTGADVDWSGLVGNFLPSGGGKQMDRTFKWMEDAGIMPRIDFNITEGLTIDSPKPGAYNQKNELKYPVELDDPFDILKGAAFGTYETKYGRDYLDQNRMPLSENQTSGVEQLAEMGADFGDAYEAMRTVGKIGSAKDLSGNTITNSSGALKRQYLENQGLWDEIGVDIDLADIFGVKKTVFEWTQKEFEEFLKSIGAFRGGR